jgi:alpha-2-macroglobulin
LPIDVVKSLVKGWPQGTISRTDRFFKKLVDEIACYFDDSYCNYYSENKFRNKHTGYIVFNKPKYLPGDTVKFKAFLLTRKGKPVHMEVNVILYVNSKSIELTKLKPYRDGGYEYQFFLHDSLKLQLDRDYNLDLELNDRKEYIRGTFKYEDYELSKNKLKIRLDEKKQYKGKPFKAYISGTDENDLNLLDARLEIFILPKEINEYLDKKVFIPDTLYFTKKDLEAGNETEIFIPDSIFPKINLKYDLHVRLLTSDNEMIVEDENVDYYHFKRDFNIALKKDSIEFIYKENGSAKAKNVKITAIDNFGNKTELLDSITPCKLLLNPYYAKYSIKSDSLEKSIDISSEPSLLECRSERTKDSLYIVVDNPRQIPFIYNIYKKNSEKSRGYSDSLTSILKAPNEQNYFVTIRYLWGGKVKNENYRIPLIDKKLNLTVTQPKIVYPGQKTRIEILVTDMNGNPVQGVDLTAYALTKKFNYNEPDLPYLGKNRKSKNVINNFNFKDPKFDIHSGLKLNYEEWKLLAGIDSIEYYKFLYPGNRIYRFEYEPRNMLTQFAPFIVSKGVLQPIDVVWIDSKPVYFGWSTNTQPYSFRIDPGYHQIRLRTTYNNIIIDSLNIHDGKKLILSIDVENPPKNILIYKADPELSVNEKRLLYRYIFPYRNTFGDRYAYLEQDNEIQFLKPAAYSTYSKHFAGPVAGNVTFNLLDSFSINFDHEPFYEYEFTPGLLKMRSLDE